MATLPERLGRRYLLPAGFALLLLILLVDQVAWPALMAALHAVHPARLAGATALLLVARYGFQLDRWGRTLSALGCRLRAGDLLRIGLASGSLQLGTPGKLGTVLVAAAFERGGRLDAPAVLSSMALPSLHSGIMLLALAPLGLGLWEAPGAVAALLPTGTPSRWGLVAGAGALVLGVAALVRAFGARSAPRRGPLAWTRGLAAVFLRIPPGIQVALFLYSAFCFLLEVAAVGLLLRACGVTPPLPLLVGGICLVLLVANLPVSLGGLGTREAATLVLFAAYGAPATLLAAGLLWSVLFYLLPIALGLPWVPGLLGAVLEEGVDAPGTTEVTP
ncbi:MAG: lysylphosphatidylglycerol synthase transmembrane domain-containing protein [Pseudomonadota bacterium]